jgi:hypothetical protein
MSVPCLRLVGQLLKARKPRGLTFITRHSRSIGKAPRCSSTNLNLTTKSLILPRKVTVLGRNHVRATMRAHPFVQGRKANPKSSATWRRESPLVSAIRTASLRNSSVLIVPMVHLFCCTMGDQRSGTKP